MFRMHAVWRCPSCGFKNAAGTKRCVSCGSKTAALSAIERSKQEQLERRYQQEAFSVSEIDEVESGRGSRARPD